MKSFTKTALTGIAIILFFNAFAAVQANAQGGAVLNEILKRMDVHRKNLNTLRADVKMVKFDSVLKVSDTQEGSAMYVPGSKDQAYFRVDWRKPTAETLSVLKTKYIIYRPGINQAVVGTTDGARSSAKTNNLFSFLSMSKAQLKAAYTVTMIGEEFTQSDVSTAHLQMTPKGASSYKSADIWVDKDGMPIQIRITEKNNDMTTILLSGIKKNSTINLAEFQVNLPADVDMVNG